MTVSEIGKGLPGKLPQHPSFWSNVGRLIPDAFACELPN
jgi:hypothetical protein